MMSANIRQVHKSQLSFAVTEKVRCATEGNEPVIFTDIYQEDINMAIWQRELSTEVKTSVSDFLQLNPYFQTAMTLTPHNALLSIEESLGDKANSKALSENIAELIDMFAYLFVLQRVGLRLSVLQQAMCPKFHVDRVPCRLITTYHGMATEWLSDDRVDRTKLGRGSNGLSDSQSGLYQHHGDIQQLRAGDVALLKGELWKNNDNAGLVHRSPALSFKESRLLLTLDFSD